MCVCVGFLKYQHISYVQRRCHISCITCNASSSSHCGGSLARKAAKPAVTPKAAQGLGQSLGKRWKMWEKWGTPMGKHMENMGKHDGKHVGI